MNHSKESLQILIIEDNNNDAYNLKKALRNQSHISIIDHVKNETEALEILHKNKQINFVFMDLMLGDEKAHEEPGGVKISRIIQHTFNQNSPNRIKILALTSLLEGKWIKEMFDLGVKGYISKDSREEEILNAIHQIQLGNLYYRGNILNILHDFQRKMDALPKNSEQPKLTPTEKEILTYLKKGLTTKEIAKLRGKREGVIEIHRRNLIEKFKGKNPSSTNLLS